MIGESVLTWFSGSNITRAASADPPPSGSRAAALSAVMIASARSRLVCCSCEDLFLDRVAWRSGGRRRRAGLADAVGAVDGLGFDGGVPPGIEQEDVLGGGEVQAEAAGLEADRKSLQVGVVLEALDRVLAVAGFAVEVFVAGWPARVEALGGRCARKLVNCEKTSALWPSSRTSSSWGRACRAWRWARRRGSCRSGRDGRRPGAGGAALRGPGSWIGARPSAAIRSASSAWR